MKKLLALCLALQTTAFAVTHISLAGGSSTTIRPSNEDVVVSCALSGPPANTCQIKTNSYGYFYIEQGGNRISELYTADSQIMKALVKYKAEGICP